ncbi:hypothetical protein CCACVL1_28003 [Corchorus capsularis]|uniref:DUF4283 domain-containing protein n=1 Tax=Corchorus capsularis TaxID=210143 RepID=A0A1R3G7U2_COCAP|nr:hypothetical protein CCACVL1_28003 [Corchorus capsularis]
MEMCSSKFHLWDDSGEERISQVWIKVEGVPLFLWHPNFFQEIASSWGKLIKVTDVTLERSTMVAAWFLIEVQNKACFPPIFVGSWRGFRFVLRISIDEKFTDEHPFESGGDGIVNVDGGSSNACSNSEEGMKSFCLEKETLEVRRTINDDSIEMVRETVSNGKHVESPKNALSLALGEVLLVGGGFIAENGKEVDSQNVSARNKEFSIGVGEDGYLQNLEVGPKKLSEECNSYTEALMCAGLEGMEESGAKHDGQRSEEGVSRGEVV